LSKRKQLGNKYLKRKGPVRRPNKLILIVCEGAKTEPTYFNAIRREKRISSAIIKIVPGNISGPHPKNVVTFAKEEEKVGDYDEVWCVFDRDEHEDIATAIDVAKRSGLYIAYSNPSFELWFLYHFQSQTAHIERDDLITTLKRYIPDYDKSMNVYDIISQYETRAIEQAERVRKWHCDNCDPEIKNPSTSVDKLLRCLRSIELIPNRR
jgi:hypothetical protein